MTKSIHHHTQIPYSFAPARLSPAPQLTRGINTGGLLQRIRGYRSALEGLSGRNTATAALVNERLAKIDETIRKEFIQL